MPWPAIIATIGSAIAVPMFTAWLARTAPTDVSKLATKADLVNVATKADLDKVADACGKAFEKADGAASQFKGLAAQVDALQKKVSARPRIRPVPSALPPFELAP